MIKALLTDKETGARTVLLGLSDENWRRMRTQDQPIRFGLSVDGKPITVAIMAGPDEDSMRARIAEWQELPDERAE